MTPPVLDRAVFEAVADANRVRTGRLVEAFKRSARTSLDQLALAAEKADHAAARAAGHRLVSGAASIGALALSALGREIEAVPDSIEPAGLDALLARTRKAVGEAVAALEAALGELADR